MGGQCKIIRKLVNFIAVNFLHYLSLYWQDSQSWETVFHHPTSEASLNSFKSREGSFTFCASDCYCQGYVVKCIVCWLTRVKILPEGYQRSQVSLLSLAAWPSSPQPPDSFLLYQCHHLNSYLYFYLLCIFVLNKKNYI